MFTPSLHKYVVVLLHYKIDCLTAYSLLVPEAFRRRSLNLSFQETCDKIMSLLFWFLCSPVSFPI